MTRKSHYFSPNFSLYIPTWTYPCSLPYLTPLQLLIKLLIKLYSERNNINDYIRVLRFDWYEKKTQTVLLRDLCIFPYFIWNMRSNAEQRLWAQNKAVKLFMSAIFTAAAESWQCRPNGCAAQHLRGRGWGLPGPGHFGNHLLPVSAPAFQGHERASLPL